MLLQSLYFSRFLPNRHCPLSSFDTHARWQSVTQSCRSRWSYGKMEDCEQSNQQGTHNDANDTKTHCLPFSADSIIIVPWLISKTDFHKYAVTEVLSWNSRETLEQKGQVCRFISKRQIVDYLSVSPYELPSVTESVNHATEQKDSHPLSIIIGQKKRSNII